MPPKIISFVTMLQVKEVLCPFRNVNVPVNSMPFRQEDLYIDEQPGEF